MEQLAQVFVTANEYVCTMSISCCQNMNFHDAIVQVKASVLSNAVSACVLACECFVGAVKLWGRKCSKSDKSSGRDLIYFVFAYCCSC